MPVLLFCIAFGLSMDYEVFLMSPRRLHNWIGINDNEASKPDPSPA
ncbi:MAG: hypothetical protein ACR2FF_08520 [Mycobacteriales bacterium]